MHHCILKDHGTFKEICGTMAVDMTQSNRKKPKKDGQTAVTVQSADGISRVRSTLDMIVAQSWFGSCDGVGAMLACPFVVVNFSADHNLRPKQ